jgi:transposase
VERRLVLSACAAGRSEEALHPGKLPKPIVDLGWKAQVRLCDRYRKLTVSGKRNTVVTTAVAREFAGFVWAIGQEVRAAA